MIAEQTPVSFFSCDKMRPICDVVNAVEAMKRHGGKAIALNATKDKYKEASNNRAEAGLGGRRDWFEYRCRK